MVTVLAGHVTNRYRYRHILIDIQYTNTGPAQSIDRSQNIRCVHFCMGFISGGAIAAKHCRSQITLITSF